MLVLQRMSLLQRILLLLVLQRILRRMVLE
jgi:hypothetical protein